MGAVQRAGTPACCLMAIIIMISAGCTPHKPWSASVKPHDAAIWKWGKPDWIDGPSRHYPAESYLQGVGYAADRQTAEDRARTEIAKIFFSQVEAQNSAYQSYLRTETGGKLKTTEKIDIEDMTRVSTRKILSGVKVAEIYKEKRPKEMFYVLAVLDRVQAQQILRAKIRDLDTGIRKLFSDARSQGDNLMKIKYLSLGLKKMILRHTYNTELRIVNPNGQGIPAVTPLSDVRQELERLLLHDFQIGLTLKGDRVNQIRPVMVEELNRQGFAVAEDGEKARIWIRGRVVFNPFEPKDSEWKYVRWKAFFDIHDPQSGAIFGSVNKSGKEGHLSLSQAEQRVVKKMRKILITDIVRELKDYIVSSKE